MEHDALIAAFRDLPTNESRLKGIEALIRELTSQELRETQRLTAALTFQTDIIGQLPVELVAQVFSYLDTSTPYRLQRVSRKWHHVLRSRDVLTKSLVSWYGDTPQIQQADYSLCRLKARSVHGFRYGVPTHHFKISLSHRKDSRMILRGDTLVFPTTTPPLRALHLFNIKTWTFSSLNGNARELIRHFFASDQIAGFTTESHTCYISDLEGRGKRKFKVPSTALFQSVACRGRTVACAGFVQGHIQVYIWNYDTQQGKSFIIPRKSHLVPFGGTWREHQHGLALLLQPETERIIVFTDERCSGGNDFDEQIYCPSEDDRRTFRYAQFKYDGECLFESKMTVEESDPRQQSNFQDGVNSFTPVDDQGTFKISVGSYTDLPGTHSVWLQFDERTNAFTQPTPVMIDGSMRAAPHHFWWKDTIFSLEVLLTELSITPKISLKLTLKGTREESHNKPIFEETEISSYGIVARDSVYLNEKYLVRNSADGFHIFCFEHDVHFPVKSGPFFEDGIVEIMDVQKNVQADG